MYLFCATPIVTSHQLVIRDKELIQQLRKVLRFQKGSQLVVQDQGKSSTVRYTIQLDDRTDKSLSGTILSTETKQYAWVKQTMLIAMPNKRQKAELIVQKLTEVGIQHIVFWPAERSIIRERNTNKIARLEKIAQEAAEQSWNWRVPKIEFVEAIDTVLKDAVTIVFDKKKNSNTNALPAQQETKNTVWIVWPEGGLTDKDYANFGENIVVKSLGESILRMETAAIVAGWILINGQA